MQLSPIDFHKQTFNTVRSSVRGAVEYGLEISSMPPQFSVISSQPIISDQGEDALEVYSAMPEILQDVDPSVWSWLARSKMSDLHNTEGFVFWCLVEDGESKESVFCFSYKKGGDSYSFLCTTEFEDVRVVNPYEVVPYLDDDYEAEMVVH